jgi:hypothetical protein
MNIQIIQKKIKFNNRLKYLTEIQKNKIQKILFSEIEFFKPFL